MAKAIPKCPSCNSDNVVPIVFGFPGPESMDRWLSQLNFVSTSCSTFPDNPGGFTE